MKVGDLMYCTFATKGYATILSKNQHKFWNILWNGKITLMHEDHLTPVS